ncbi:L-arabinose isomerase [Glycomyces albus]
MTKQLWFVTGSQHLYGPEAIDQVAANSADIVAGLDEAGAIPAQVVAKPVLTTADEIRNVLLEANGDDDCIGVIAWMHTFSPAKMWIAGLGALDKPLLHLHTQHNRDLPWADIDMDFMNLNQAAHGDREFGYMLTRLRHRRKTVVGHWADEKVQKRIGDWTRAALGWNEVQNLKLVRFGDNMRNVGVTEGDKVEAQIKLGVQVNTFGVNELADRVAEIEEKAVDALCEEYEASYDVVAELKSGGARHLAARRRPHRTGSALLPGRAGRQGLHRHVRGLGRAQAAPGHRRAAADGRGLRLRRRGRLEDRGPGAPDEGHGDRSRRRHVLHGGLHLQPGRRVPADPRRAHARGVPSIAAEKPTCEIHPLGIGDREDPVRLVFTAPPGPAIAVGMMDLGTRLRLVANEVDTVEPEQDLPNLPVARAVWKPRPDLETSAESWLTAGGPHHTSYTMAFGREVMEDFAEIAGIELVTIGEGTTTRDFKQQLRWNQVYHHLEGAL